MQKNNYDHCKKSVTIASWWYFLSVLGYDRFICDLENSRAAISGYSKLFRFFPIIDVEKNMRVRREFVKEIERKKDSEEEGKEE